MNLLAFQNAFAHAVRQPQHQQPLVSILDKPEHMPVYQELVFNNIKTFIDACFPVSSACLGEAHWLILNQAFVAEHRCTTPFFREIPAEFVHWVESLCEEKQPFLQQLKIDLPGYLPYLLHYEWLELLVQTHGSQAWEPVRQRVYEPSDSLFVTVNPSVQLAAYPYAVHVIAPGEPVCEQATFLMVWRDGDFDVQFATLQVASYLLIDALQAHSVPQVFGLHELALELSQALGYVLGKDLVWQELVRLQDIGVLRIELC